MEHVNVVAAVIANRGKLLCMQRGITRYQYTSLRWEFPGGKIKEGETEEEALRRELKEEMDYEVTIGDKICEVTHTYPDFTITMSATTILLQERKTSRTAITGIGSALQVQVSLLPPPSLRLPRPIAKPVLDGPRRGSTI